MMMTGHYEAYTRATAVHQHTKHMLASMHHPPPPRTHRPTRTSRSSSRTKKRSKAWRQKRNKRKRKPFKPTHTNNLSDTETLYSQMHIQDLSGAEDNMDVSDDFLKFMEQSVKHREEYRVLSKQMEHNNKNTNNDNNNTPTQDGDISVPKEHPDVRRSREMKELYGEAAPRIHAMETALQLSFDRISTLHHPQFWPNTPLMMMFEEGQR
ncbi:hypothetical protein Pmani_019539 [Petrolisthes manimaculis]|uniref:Uncharacterized protein n=1 Tax=Petrolisthes manimaculis TaxID=1843537 RepID=A0AAE1PKJ6_9EUCA|nr:hypothetical protein Pmani_019539 [Petrolisthes manimaculis]